MYMKNIIRLFFAAVLLLPGCVPEDDSFFATSFHNVSTITAPANVPYIKNITNGAKLPIGLLGKSEAKDIENVTLLAVFVPDGATPDPTTEEDLLKINNYPDTVVIAQNDLLSLAQKSSIDELNAGDRWIITYKVTLTSGEVLTSSVKTNITFTCQSDLAGTYTYSTTNIVGGAGGDVAACGATATGSGTLEEVSGGVYKFTDNAFGLLLCLYDDAPSVGTLTFNDLCGKVFWEGGDQYGDTYTMEIVSNNGTDLTFEWENTYGDGGVTTLTRTDGKEWPAGLFTN